MWNKIDSAPENVLVMTKIDDYKGVRNEAALVRNGHLWYSDSMYMYYTPTHWRPLTDIEKMKIKSEAERKAIALLKETRRLLGQ